MLKQRFRLKSFRLFKQTLNGETLGVTPFFALMGLRHHPSFLAQQTDPNRLLPRFGFIVSKKVEKRATRRNRVKRWLREAVRTRLLPEQKDSLKQYRTIIIIARPKSLAAGFHSLADTLVQCFGRVVKSR